jgi:hypothetical protein
MIPIVENVLTEIIESRLKVIKSKPDIVDSIFSQTTVTMRNRLKEYILQGKIRVVRGFPNDRATLPCYAIMLGGEQEQEKTLGSVLDGDLDDHDLLPTDEPLVAKRASSKVIVQVTNKPIELVNAVVDYSGVDLPFEVIDENRGIIQVWNAKHGDELQVSYVHREGGKERYGSLFNIQYRIETWTNNGDLTIMLYHLLKWMLLSSRNEIEEYGLALQTLGGADFEPAPEYLPEFVYRRALTFTCVTENSYEVDYSYIQGFNIDGDL